MHTVDQRMLARLGERWHAQADLAPPPALEHRLMAAFDARANEHRARRRQRMQRHLAGLALAASLGAAALLMPISMHNSQPATTPLSAQQQQLIRDLDRALQAAYDSGDQAQIQTLWQRREHAMIRAQAPAQTPTEAHDAPISL